MTPEEFAERALLGVLVRNPERISEVGSHLDRRDFTAPWRWATLSLLREYHPRLAELAQLARAQQAARQADVAPGDVLATARSAYQTVDAAARRLTGPTSTDYQLSVLDNRATTNSSPTTADLASVRTRSAALLQQTTAGRSGHPPPPTPGSARGWRRSTPRPPDRRCIPMPGPDSPDRHRRAPRALAAMVGLLVVAAGCSTTDDRTGTGGAGPAGSVPSAASTPSATGVSPSDPDSPLSAAVGWLMAYHGASWTDGTPAAWIDRVRPYVTDTLHASNETLRSGGGGIDWTDFVRQQCTSTVTDTHALIPPESPGTDTSANVQVTGTIHTTCTAGVPTRPTEPASATLVVVTTAHGWRIDHRLF